MEERTDIHRKLIKKVLEGRATSEEKKLLSETEAVKRRMRQQWEQSNGRGKNVETDRQAMPSVFSKETVVPHAHAVRSLRISPAIDRFALVHLGAQEKHSHRI